MYCELTSCFKGGKQTSYSYDTKHRLEWITAPGITAQYYAYDDKGNLGLRSEDVMGQYEEFTYDAMNRLKTWKQNGMGDGYLMNYSDASGAITRKTDLGYYTDFKYESSKPHAVTSLENLYDATPPLPSSQLAATYTNFKKLATLTEGNKSYALTYGVDDQRRRSTYSDRGTVKQTCYYLGDYELERQSDGSERSIHYLSGGDGLAAIYVTREFGRDTFMYAYTDNLGLITTLTDANHNVMERYAYDPWGGRRNPTNWAQKDERTAWLTNRGYAGHEHLDRFGIISRHSDGRADANFLLMHTPLVTISFWLFAHHIHRLDDYVYYDSYTP